jgi:GntR family transcriptional repressor for pyruvate dehydrogenase complex
MELRTIKKLSAVDAVIDYIKGQIMREELQPGQKILGEIELAEGLKVGRGTIREAMKILSALGIVDVRSGDGTYIRESSKGASLNPLLFDFILYGPDKKELSQFRKVIEVAIVELIILNKDKNVEECRLLDENLEKLRVKSEEGDDTEFFIKNDIDFHRLMGKACYNYLAQKVYDFVLDFLEPTIVSTHNLQQNGVYSYPVHKLIVEAIHTNDLSKARDAIYYSVQIWDNLRTTS